MKLFGAALLSVWALTAQADPVDDLLETLGSDALIDVLVKSFSTMGIRLVRRCCLMLAVQHGAIS